MGERWCWNMAAELRICWTNSKHVFCVLDSFSVVVVVDGILSQYPALRHAAKLLCVWLQVCNVEYEEVAAVSSP